MRVALPPLSGARPEFRVQKVDFQRENMLVFNPGFRDFDRAPFSVDDLRNLETSLRQSLPAISGSLEPVYVSVTIDGTLLTYGGAEMGMLSVVSWDLSDGNGQPFFSDSFYVARYHASKVTRKGDTSWAASGLISLGGLKEDMMRKVVTRILLTAMTMVNGERNIRTACPKGTYDTPESALGALPPTVVDTWEEELWRTPTLVRYRQYTRDTPVFWRRILPRMETPESSPHNQ